MEAKSSNNWKQYVGIRGDTWGSRKVECQRKILLFFTITPHTGTSATSETAFLGFLDGQTLDLALLSLSLLYPVDQDGTWAAYTWKKVSENAENKGSLPGKRALFGFTCALVLLSLTYGLPKIQICAVQYGSH